MISTVEYHDGSSEGILPLDRFEAFRVPAGTFVALHAGVWHHAPYALGREAVNVLIVLPERAYAMDCSVTEIPEKEQIGIEI